MKSALIEACHHVQTYNDIWHHDSCFAVWFCLFWRFGVFLL